MVDCALILTDTNVVPESTITTNLSTTYGTPDDLKTHFRARCNWYPFAQTETDDLVISGLLPEGRTIRYWSLPQNNMESTQTVQLTLRADSAAGAVLYQSPLLTATEFIPGGSNWRHGRYLSNHSFANEEVAPWEGVKPYGGNLMAQGSPTAIRFIDAPVTDVRHWEIRLNLRRTSSRWPSEWIFRMVMLGDYVQLSKGHSLGGVSGSLTDPNLGINNDGFADSFNGRLHRRRLSVPLRTLSDSDRYILSKHERKHANDFFIVCPYPQETRWLYSEQTFVGSYTDAMAYGQTHQHLSATEAQFFEL